MPLILFVSSHEKRDFSFQGNDIKGLFLTENRSEFCDILPALTLSRPGTGLPLHDPLVRAQRLMSKTENVLCGVEVSVVNRATYATLPLSYTQPT